MGKVVVHKRWGRSANHRRWPRVVERRRVRKTDRHSDAQLALRSSFIEAAGGRDFGVAASHRHADVSLSPKRVVAVVKTGPTQSRQKCMDPGSTGDAVTPGLS